MSNDIIAFFLKLVERRVPGKVWYTGYRKSFCSLLSTITGTGKRVAYAKIGLDSSLMQDLFLTLVFSHLVHLEASAISIDHLDVHRRTDLFCRTGFVIWQVLSNITRMVHMGPELEIREMCERDNEERS